MGRTENGKEQLYVGTKIYLKEAVEYVRKNVVILERGNQEDILNANARWEWVTEPITIKIIKKEVGKPDHKTDREDKPIRNNRENQSARTDRSMRPEDSGDWTPIDRYNQPRSVNHATTWGKRTSKRMTQDVTVSRDNATRQHIHSEYAVREKVHEVIDSEDKNDDTYTKTIHKTTDVTDAVNIKEEASREDQANVRERYNADEEQRGSKHEPRSKVEDIRQRTRTI